VDKSSSKLASVYLLYTRSQFEQLETTNGVL